MSNRAHGHRVGLGSLIYSVDGVAEERTDVSAPDQVVEEASEESFPASDPPGYAKGVTEDATVPPDSEGEGGPSTHTEAVRRMTENDQPDRR